MPVIKHPQERQLSETWISTRPPAASNSLRDARKLIAAWRTDFNHHRPHTSLAGLTPVEYANRSAEDQKCGKSNPGRGHFG
ncbi:MAG: integrase core domain-containing protein [Sulfitobacter sp.]